MSNEENEEEVDVKKERNKLDKMGVKGTFNLLEGKKKKGEDTKKKREKDKPFT
jgi:hypothetical protein